MSEDTFTRTVLDVADRVASELAERYNVEPDDVRSVAYLAAYERRPWLEVAATEEPWMVEAAISRAVKSHYHSERVKAMAETAQYVYQVEYVRLFLPFWFAKVDWTNGPINDDSVSEWRTGEALDTALDISEAYSTLRDWQTSVIGARHAYGPDSWDDVAIVTGRINGEAAARAYRDATQELTNAMNVNRERRGRTHSGLGNRTVISNSKANGIVSHYA